jgi:hypothetical protein
MGSSCSKQHEATRAVAPEATAPDEKNTVEAGLVSFVFTKEAANEPEPTVVAVKPSHMGRLDRRHSVGSRLQTHAVVHVSDVYESVYNARC